MQNCCLYYVYKCVSNKRLISPSLCPCHSLSSSGGFCCLPSPHHRCSRCRCCCCPGGRYGGPFQRMSPPLPGRPGRSWGLGPAPPPPLLILGATTVQAVVLSEASSASPSSMASCVGSATSVVGGGGAFFNLSAKVSLRSLKAPNLFLSLLTFGHLLDQWCVPEQNTDIPYVGLAQ